MPKIHRIRIVNLKYDGMQKQYKDTTFNFHNEETSTNALIAMMNGGGKGVFLQTIFQILKPGTSWGKQNNRYYQQFFFNNKEQFIPYTFHVLIQWELDGADRRYLITGGIFSAEQRISMSEESGYESKTLEQEAKILPTITFYTREFERKEEAALEHIPLYDNDEVAEIESLKDYLKWNGYDVYRDTKKHYRILDTYGINRKDWDIMKDINKDEGGVGKYFEGAEDDHSLFQKRIVPTVSQVLHRTEHQKNDLVEIFKSQASIAKDLPVLLKREQAHKEFLEDIVPFEEHLAKGVEHKEIVQASIQAGRQLLGALEHLKQTEEEMLLTLEKDMEKLIIRQAELRYQKDNLEYAKAHSEVMDWEKKLVEERKKHTSLQAIVLEKQERKEALVFQALLKEWSENEQTIRSLSQQIATLEQNSGLEQVNQRMEEIKQEAKKQWEQSYLSIQEAIKQYVGYQKFLKKKGTELSQQDKQKTKKIAQLSTEIDFLYTQMHAFESKEAALIQAFGDRLSYDLKGLIESLFKQIEDKKARLVEVQAKDKESSERQNQLATSHGTLVQSIQFSEEKCEELNLANEEQMQREAKLLDKLHGLLDDATAPFTHSLLSKYSIQIEEILSNNRQQAEQIKKELWETQLDHSLNDEPFWVANKDVKELKEWIDEKTGIDVFYGTQFLQSLRAEDLANNLMKYPLLPYGLVVSGQQWQKINQQVLSGRMFKSPVPIFLREEMNSEYHQTSFVIINGTEQELLTDKNQFTNWKIKIAKQIEEKKDTLLEIEKTETSLRRVLKEIDRFLSSDLSIDIEKALNQEQNARLSKKKNLQEIQAQEEKEKELQLQLKEQLENTKGKIEKLTKDVETLEDFDQEKTLHQENKRVKLEKEKQKEALGSQQQEIGKELQNTVELQNQWNQTYLEWKLTSEQTIKEIRFFIEEAVFPTDEKADPCDEVPHLSSHLLEKINGSIGELKQLQKSKEEQARELLVLQAKKETEQKQQKKLEKKLTAHDHDQDWNKAAEPDEPISILETMLQTAQKEAKTAEKEEREQGTAVTVAETSLKHATEQRDKSGKKVEKHEKQPEEWEGFDLEVKALEIKDQTKLTKEEVKQAEKRQKETETNIAGFEGDLLTLSVILKEEAAAFTNHDLEKIKSHGKACILSWCEGHQVIQEEGKEKHAKIDQSLRNLKLTIEGKDWEIRFKNEVLTTLDHMDTRHYTHIQTIVKNMKRFSQSGLEQLERDKERAEKAQNFWASRASMKVMSISEAIRSMVSKMKLKNERGSFPLVQLKEDILPKKAEDIEPLLKQHFVTAINKITKQFDMIDDHNRLLDEEIKQLISDEQILFVSLRNRYPELLVYNMRTDNAFMYGKPQREHYSTWQTINQGSKTKSDGSGGQKLSARMVMMMMLLSVKSETDQSWVPLVCDNPFGQAASAHVLDPIFAVAEKLKFQFIVVTPPELVKTEISQRFDAYYKLDFIREKGKEIVSDTIVPAFRIYEGEAVVQ
ncbi:hypothetical protein J7E79_25985 [Bacillus sp. ISL-40]|uniref:hypothetical protein n=1 Tax=unclassified Bacillus (in: firmicutes) TaxID=185979 RepID=UPI001BEB6CAE|nr:MULTISPECIES: hypothetical protein [unclassified Bacillus (in: firmicutes)]MBT2700784.1 hypothetical protein [Bacillus sp. ISL-40]MBT2742690.1 hypothetical protein [Bacillus sp. ISL-77]